MGGGKGKTLEAQGTLFRRGFPTLQTSLTLPELPCTAIAGLVCKNFSRFWSGGCRAGKILVDWEVRGGKKCGFALDWWGNENEDSALIRRLRRHLPPQRGRLSEALLIPKRVLWTFSIWIFTF